MPNGVVLEGCETVRAAASRRRSNRLETSPFCLGCDCKEHLEQTAVQWSSFHPWEDYFNLYGSRSVSTAVPGVPSRFILALPVLPDDWGRQALLDDRDGTELPQARPIGWQRVEGTSCWTTLNPMGGEQFRNDALMRDAILLYNTTNAGTRSANRVGAKQKKISASIQSKKSWHAEPRSQKSMTLTSTSPHFNHQTTMNAISYAFDAHPLHRAST